MILFFDPFYALQPFMVSSSLSPQLGNSRDLSQEFFTLPVVIGVVSTASLESASTVPED
jgi:hypothetical protein